MPFTSHLDQGSPLRGPVEAASEAGTDSEDQTDLVLYYSLHREDWRVVGGWGRPHVVTFHTFLSTASPPLLRRELSDAVGIGDDDHVRARNE